MKTTIAIPCLVNHVKWLDTAFENIANGTCLPDEVLVAISPSPTEDPIAFDIVKKYKDRLNIKVFFLDRPGAIFAKHFLTQHITGDLVLYHDADDYQHLQRVEIVKKFFENFDIVHLCHSYSYEIEGCYGKLDYDKIKYVHGDSFRDKYCLEKDHPSLDSWKKDGIACFGVMTDVKKVTDGAMCIKRSVLDKIKWNEIPENFIQPAPDMWFCMSVFKEFNKTMLIDAPVYIYRKNP